MCFTGFSACRGLIKWPLISLDLQKLGQSIGIGGFRPHRSSLFHQRGG